MHEHEHNHTHEKNCSCHNHSHEAHNEHHHTHEHNHEHEEHGQIAKIIVASVFFVIALCFEHIPLKNFESYRMYAVIISSLIAYLFCGKDVVIQAIKNLFNGNIFDEQFLMSVASIGAVCTKQFPEAVAIMLFYQIGELFEDYASEKSEKSISSLMEICPDTATVLENNEWKTVTAESVTKDQIILVKPGERIPVDGIIIEGTTFLDNSALTGESVPKEATVESEVFSGAINKSSAIKIRALRPANQSAAGRILQLVTESSGKKAKTERFITKFSRIYTPIVCAIAVLVAFVPPLFIKFVLAQQDVQWSSWIYKALMILVVSCPCAIVISIPLTFFGGIGSASRNGILLKGSKNIESLAKTKILGFDKTGTLTHGTFSVTDIFLADSSITKDELLKIASHAESLSCHPVANSIKNAHQGECCKSINTKDFTEIAGKGISVLLDGVFILAGNKSLMKEKNISGFDAYEEYSKNSKDLFGTVIHIAKENKYLGSITISDTIKEDSKKAVKELNSLGIKNIVMLTGDNEQTAKKVAQELNINEWYAELMPEEKLLKVEELISELKKGTLAFAGDGINDAPVLTRANTGIAMGALGSDAAIESADVVITTDEPSKIAKAISISRKTLGIVYQNIVFSLALKVLIILLSASGIGNMWLAVFGDVGITFIAILNAMRMLRF